MRRILRSSCLWFFQGRFPGVTSTVGCKHYCLITDCCTHFHRANSMYPRCSCQASLQRAQCWGGVLPCYGRWLWWHLPPLQRWRDLGMKRELLSSLVSNLQNTEDSWFLCLVLQKEPLEATCLLWQVESSVFLKVHYQFDMGSLERDEKGLLS